ncbi:pentatricopeptide repeat-containing protein At5g66520-like [Phalaenopsis equestris]|uniref:pentatricopeptide repeat-containing protein At5g66520-like n=1 Tax=Phalaenopsis equestris TaxID=78828 RepID=UPI0009E5697E|nr:pentatricopeptide repeat-containing protein At5g66520-like [Phalaenopsis equestris]
MLAKKLALLLHPNLSISLTAFICSSEIKATHAHLIVTGRTTDTFATSRLLAAAAIPFSRDLKHAGSLFSSLPSPTIFSYNTMIRAFSHSPQPIQSLHLYAQMLRSGLSPNHLTLPFLLRSCSSLRLPNPGTSLHCHSTKLGLERDIFITNNTITMYSTLLDMPSAQRVFEEHIESADVVTWTALITGYSNIGAIDVARSLFNRAPSRNLVTYNAMLAGYARAGRTLEARHLFDEMTVRNSASWSSLISGFVQAGLTKTALAIFHKMARQSVQPNEPLLVSTISACSQLRALEHGRSVHRYIETLGINITVIIGSALVDMYGKCGGIKEAIHIFNTMPERNIYTWNSIITGLAMNGAGRQVLTLFYKMTLAGVSPNNITFIDLLSACSHNGLVEEGRMVFDEMTRVYGIVPEEEHYGCMVDLLGRAGLIEEALDFIGRMPIEPHPGVWGALAGACRIHGEMELGEEISRWLIELEPSHGGRYIHLSNIYGDGRRWNEMAMVRRVLKERRAVKPPGGSSVDVQHD